MGEDFIPTKANQIEADSSESHLQQHHRVVALSQPQQCQAAHPLQHMEVRRGGLQNVRHIICCLELMTDPCQGLLL
jgi:hypothetical protein